MATLVRHLVGVGYHIASFTLPQNHVTTSSQQDFMISLFLNNLSLLGFYHPAIFLQRWDDELAQRAQLYAESCTLTRDSASYGENIQFTQGSNINYTDTITKWYSEGEYYDYYCNHCEDGKSCDQYKQVRRIASVELF